MLFPATKALAGPTQRSRGQNVDDITSSSAFWGAPADQYSSYYCSAPLANTRRHVSISFFKTDPFPAEQSGKLLKLLFLLPMQAPCSYIRDTLLPARTDICFAY